MRPPEQEYQLDDLIRDQRRQMYFAAACIVAFMIYALLGGRLPGGEGPAPPPTSPEAIAPAGSAAR